MSRGAIVSSIIAVFLLGASLGLMGGMAFARLERSSARQHGAPGGSSRRGDPMPRLTKELGLTPEQAERIRPMLTESRREFDAVRESLRVHIGQELTPQQRTRWQQMIEERKARHANDSGQKGTTK